MIVAPRKFAWRPLLLGACLFVALLTTIQNLDGSVLNVSGIVPFDADTSGSPYVVVVTRVEPSSKRAGLRLGDRIDLRDYSFEDRYAIASGLAPQGYRVNLRLHRGRLVQHAMIVARPPRRTTMSLSYWVGIFSTYWLILFSTLIAWRRPDTPLARWIVAYMLLWFWPFLATTSETLNAVWYGLSLVGLYLLFVFPATIFALFGRPLSRSRLSWTMSTYALVALGTLLSEFGYYVGLATLWFDPDARPFRWHLGPYSIGFHLFSAAAIASLICGVLAVAAARGIDRQRATWVVLVIGAVLVTNRLAGFASYFPAGSLALEILSYMSLATSVLVPVGLSYVVLNRRLLDIGFVLNRAAVFTVVSLVLLGLFIIGEWALSEWYAAAHRATNMGASAALVLVLGVFMRAIHRRVDQLVDGVLFRKRHQNEMALRAFASESAFIKNLPDLEQRTISTVKNHTGATEAALFLADPGHQTYRSALPEPGSTEIQASDNAIVEMTQSRKGIDLHKTATSLVGEYAFPMFARGKLIGALVCGSKPDGEVYAPDERAALAELTRGVGLAIATLS
jgi:hypothetical protein